MMKELKLLLCFSAMFYSEIVYNQTLVINEFSAKNSSIVADNYGEYDDWIEIYNKGNQSVNLNGYYITDDIMHKFKCMLSTTGADLTIAPGGYLILWADRQTTQGTNHLNFKLSGESGTIALFDASYNFVDSVVYLSQYTDISFGRNNLLKWKFYPTPTPGKANNTQWYNGVCQPPLINVKSGFIDFPSLISISGINPKDTIRYTLNNSYPDNSSSIYNGQIKITKPTVIRAIVQKAGYVSSHEVSSIYLNKTGNALPVIAIITDSVNLFGPTGIYTNYNESGIEWERNCQMKYITDKGLEAESSMGIRIQGASSVFMDKKSFRLFFRNQYGVPEFNYPIFGDNGPAGFKRLVLKSGYDDDITTETGILLRDALSVNLWNKTGGFQQMNNWAILYLNNKYWGIYNVRESIDENFVQAHTNFKNFDLIRFHNEGAECVYGTIDDWDVMYNFILNNDFSVEENFQILDTMVNMDDLVNLMAFVHCTEYYSWGWGVSVIKEKKTGAKWRFSIWDTDRAYSTLNWDGFVELENYSSYHWANIVHKKLTRNNEFNRRLINRICDLWNSALEPDKAVSELDSIYTIVKPEMVNELLRWNPDNTNWETNVEEVRNFLRNRPEVLKNQIIDKFSLPGTHMLTVDVNGQGFIRVNKLNVYQFPWQGDYFENNTFEIEAIPYDGYHFAGWGKVEANAVPVKTLNLKENVSYTAFFEVGSSIPSVAVNSGLQVFPNPFIDQVTIRWDNKLSSNAEVSIYTVDGQLVKNIYPGKGSMISWKGDDFDGKHVKEGIYIVKLKTDHNIRYSKLLKIK